MLETERLILRKLTPDDAAFILNLLNQPSFLLFVGDKGVRTLDDAREYIRTGPVESYAKNGFGLYLVELKETGASIGMCGLLKRDSLEDPDVGFAFLPEHWSRGYAFESASAVLRHGRNVLGLDRILAIVSPDNRDSIKLLEKLGLHYTKMVRTDENAPEVKLFALAC